MASRIKPWSEADSTAYVKVQPITSEADVSFSESGKAALISDHYMPVSILRVAPTPLYGGFDVLAPQWFLMREGISW